MAFCIIRKWSKEIDTSNINCKVYIITPTLTLPMWTEAWSWKGKVASKIYHSDKYRNQYYTISEKTKVLTPEITEDIIGM